MPGNVRCGSQADISRRNRDVRFNSESGHPSARVACPLSAKTYRLPRRRRLAASAGLWISISCFVIAHASTSIRLDLYLTSRGCRHCKRLGAAANLSRDSASHLGNPG